jgi:hypothetical protein
LIHLVDQLEQLAAKVGDGCCYFERHDLSMWMDGCDVERRRKEEESVVSRSRAMNCRIIRLFAYCEH